MDNQNVVIMMFLGLSASFDNVNHKLLLKRLSQDVGVFQQALKSVALYQSDRVQSIHIQEATSPLTYGVLKVPFSGLTCSPFSCQYHTQEQNNCLGRCALNLRVCTTSLFWIKVLNAALPTASAFKISFAASAWARAPEEMQNRVSL